MFGKMKIFDVDGKLLASFVYFSKEERLKTIDCWETIFPEGSYMLISPEVFVAVEEEPIKPTPEKKYRLKKIDKIQPVKFTRPKAQYDNTTPYNIANEYR